MAFLGLLLFYFCFNIGWCSEAVIANSYQMPFYEAYNKAVNCQRTNIHRAVEYYLYALSGIPNMEQAHQNLALLYDTLGRTDLALKHHFAAEQSSNSPEFKANCLCNIVSNQLGQLSNRNIDGLQPLLDLLKKAKKLDPNNAQVVMTTAFAYINIGLYDQAILSLVDLVSRIDSSHTLGLLNIGNHFFYKKDYTTAILFYVKVLHQYLRGTETVTNPHGKDPRERYSEDLVVKSLLILNNMGQSYRELGLMRHSHTIFNFAVTEFGLLSAITDPQSGVMSKNESSKLTHLLEDMQWRRKRRRQYMLQALEEPDEEDGQNGFLDAQSRMNRVTIAADIPPQHDQLEELYVWSLMNMYSVQGLSLYWNKYEVIEEMLVAALPVCSSDGAKKRRNAQPTASSLANDDICFSSGAAVSRGAPESIFDPYTYSLIRYSSLDTDDKCLTKDVCKLCWAEPVERYNRFDYAIESKSAMAKTLRVGYLSYDWRDHPMGRLTRHLVTSHNTRYFEENTNVSNYHDLIEVYLFSYGPNDGSAIRRDIERASRENVHISLIELHRYTNDRDVANMIASAQLDILVDITSHTYNGRIELSALKPSNVIINYLGYPGTTGCQGFDYSMVDPRVVPPESSHGFTEKLIYLPYNYQSTSMPLTVPLCWTRGNSANVRSNVSSASHSSHRSALCRNRLIATIAPTRLLPVRPSVLSASSGDSHNTSIRAAILSQDDQARRVRNPETILICSFNAVKKFEPVSFAAWMNILHRLGSNALLVLIDIESPFGRDNLVSLALYHGISPNRLVFVRKSAWELHLGRAAACDVVLDNFVYGAHTTASDMIFMGVPVVALESWGSGRMPSRVAAGITRSLFTSSAAVAAADAARSTNDSTVERSRSDTIAMAHRQEFLHSLMVVHDARQYEDAVIRLFRISGNIRRQQHLQSHAHTHAQARQTQTQGGVSRSSRASSVIAQLHMGMFRQALKQPSFNKYLQQSLTERAFFTAQEVYHLEQDVTSYSSDYIHRKYHIAVAPSYYEQIESLQQQQQQQQDGQAVGGQGVKIVKDLCWDVYAAVMSFVNGQGVKVRIDTVLSWENDKERIVPLTVSEVVSHLATESSSRRDVPTDADLGACATSASTSEVENQLFAMLCRGVYGQCALLSSAYLPPQTTRLLHELCAYGEEVPSPEADDHGQSSSSTGSRNITLSETEPSDLTAAYGSYFDRLYSSDRKSSVRALTSEDTDDVSGTVKNKIPAFDRMFPPLPTSKFIVGTTEDKGWLNRIIDTHSSDARFAAVDAFIHAHYMGESGLCLAVSKAHFVQLYATDKMASAESLFPVVEQSESEGFTTTVTVADVRARLVKRLSRLVETLVISDLYDTANEGSAFNSAVNTTAESVAVCAANTASLVRELIYQILLAQSDLSEMGSTFGALNTDGCAVESALFNDYKSLFYNQHEGWPHNEVFSQTTAHAADEHREALFATMLPVLQSADSPFHLSVPRDDKNSFPLLLFSPIMKIASSIGRANTKSHRDDDTGESNSSSDYVPIDRSIASYLDVFLSNHAVCWSRRQPPDSMAAASYMLSGYVNVPSPTRLRYLGLIIQQELPRYNGFGYKIASEAILQQHLEEFHSRKRVDGISLPVFAPVGRIAHATAAETNTASAFVPLHIVFYCEEYGNAWWPNWGPSSVRKGKGVGGSEEAVIYITRELAAMGHRVEVYAEPPAVDHCRRIDGVGSGSGDENSTVPRLCSCAHTDNVCWFHYSEFDVLGDSYLDEDVHLYHSVNGKEDPVLLGSTAHTSASSIVFISWRYPLSLLLGKFRSLGTVSTTSAVVHHTYLWVHDLLPHLALPPLLSIEYGGDQLLRRLFVQSMYHQLSLPQELHHQYRILPNGISTGVLDVVRDEIVQEYFSRVVAAAESTVSGQNMMEPPVPVGLQQYSEADKNNALNAALGTKDRAFRFVYGR